MEKPKMYCRVCSAEQKISGRTCHCGACHETFTRLSGFDGHRKGGACHIPDGYSRNRWGFYMMPGRRLGPTEDDADVS